jgi:ribosomal protein L11 methyltransferase
MIARQMTKPTDSLPNIRADIRADSWAVRFAVATPSAKTVADRIGECLDATEVAVTLAEGPAGHWTIELSYPEEPDAAVISALVAEIAGADVAAGITVSTVAARDWVAESLAGLKPVTAGRFVVHGAHDRANAPRGIAMEIEAALAFGTGHHGTTRGCLMAFDRLLKAERPLRVLDVGTGTGVLAIAAAKSLHRFVLASDIDPQAVRVARANARANGVGALVGFVCAGSLTAPAFRRHGPYDLVFANILLLPLQRMAAALSRLVRPGGKVVLSGLLRTQANAALAAYRMQGLHLSRRIDLDEWSTLTLVRNSSPLPRGER